ncbi:YfgM family protein [Pseudidiomarina sp.]|uniref:YfgM family protein n=1 Tax=Pseudidiomarina sp. TaxID=2081707 RepID=UPI003A96A4AA
METEDQQIERIKQFWNEHGKGIIAGLIVGFGLFYGWRYYDAQTRANQEEASQQFESILVQLEADQENSMTAAQEFVSSSDTTYAQLAALELAKHAVDNNDYATAISALQSVRDNAEPAIRAVADIRQARLLFAQEQYDAAMAAVQAAESVTAFKAQAAELKGDILLAQGDTTGARSAYQAALDAGAEGLAEIKLNSIVAGS